MEEPLDYRPPEWVAEALGLDKTTVYRYLNDGTLPAVQLGRKWLVSRRRLDEFMAKQEQQQTARRRVRTRVAEQLLERGLDPDEVLEEAVERLSDRIIQLCKGNQPDLAVERGEFWVDVCPKCDSYSRPVVWYLEYPHGYERESVPASDHCWSCISKRIRQIRMESAAAPADGTE